MNPKKERGAQRRPNDELDVVFADLRAIVLQISTETAPSEAPKRCRRYLKKTENMVWERVLEGDYAAPRRSLELLRTLHVFIDRFRPQLAPAAQAAIDVEATLRSLYLAEEVVSDSTAKKQLGSPMRSAIEREVLRVLLRANGAYLRSGEVRDQMPPVFRRTSQRLGQILDTLEQQGLTTYDQRPAQGGQAVRFYALTSRGRQLCRELDLARRDHDLFDLSPELQRRFLTPEALVATEEAPAGKITAFVSYRGGVGRTTAIMRIANDLARRMRFQGKNVLVVDLDLDAPGLDTYYAPEGLKGCRGLAGLLFELEQLQEETRLPWLTEALGSSEFLLQPDATSQPNLWYLPSGFGPAADPEAAEVRAVAMEVLQDAASQRSIPDTTADPHPCDLIGVLAMGLRLRFVATLLDPTAGLGLPTWIAGQRLADEIVLRPAPAREDGRGTRALVANFLSYRSERSRRPGSCTFLEPSDSTDHGSFLKWLSGCLFDDATGALAVLTARVFAQPGTPMWPPNPSSLRFPREPAKEAHSYDIFLSTLAQENLSDPMERSSVALPLDDEPALRPEAVDTVVDVLCERTSIAGSYRRELLVNALAVAATRKGGALPNKILKHLTKRGYPPPEGLIDRIVDFGETAGRRELVFAP